MNGSPELVTLIQREREQHIRYDALARLASCVRACCEPSLLTRVARSLHLTSDPAGCWESARR